MKLTEFVGLRRPPRPWEDGDNIPWHEPGFSARMLREHLSQEHDAASRRTPRIDRQVAWIHETALARRATRILDLGCGPGLYASRLARLGHECVGIDYSPASIAHARAEAEREGLACRYLHQDIREAEYGAGFGLAMLLFGEFNVFRPRDADRLLAKCRAALSPGGLLLLEPHTLAAVEAAGKAAPSWSAREQGLFTDRPHLYLEEHHWDGPTRTATTRFAIINAETAEVSCYAHTFQGYSTAEYQARLEHHGFAEVEFLPSLGEGEGADDYGLLGVVGRVAEG
jgi:SAM-dependent methyltransferase